MPVFLRMLGMTPENAEIPVFLKMLKRLSLLKLPKKQRILENIKRR
jgi:hypothetical protein